MKEESTGTAFRMRKISYDTLPMNWVWNPKMSFPVYEDTFHYLWRAKIVFPLMLILLILT